MPPLNPVLVLPQALGIGDSPTFEHITTNSGADLSGIIFGSAGTSILRDATDSFLIVSGSDSTTSGGSIVLYGSTHATFPNHIIFKDSSDTNLVIDSNGNIISGGGSVAGTNATKTYVIGTGVAPVGNVADHFQMYSDDLSVGNAGPHFLTENGTSIALDQSLKTNDTVMFNSLTLTAGASTQLTLSTLSDVQRSIEANANRSASTKVLFEIEAQWNNTPVCDITFITGADAGNKDDGYIYFRTATGGARTRRLLISQYGNIIIGSDITPRENINSTKVLVFENGTPPPLGVANAAQIYAKDQAAGNSCFHTMCEDGSEVKLYRQAHIVDADGSLADITTKFNALLVNLENLGLLATS